MRGVRRWSVVLALACFGSALPLQANQLKVGISGSAPFVIKNGDQLSGISLNIWRRVAEDNNLSYELVEQPSPKACLLYTSPSPRDKRQSRMPSSA